MPELLIDEVEDLVPLEVAEQGPPGPPGSSIDYPGKTLLIDTDTYQCANHITAFGSVDTVTFSGTGGKLKIDGTNVRGIPYNTGTGNVPAIGTTVSQGGVSATLLGVWSGWQVETTAEAAEMPASGYIKVNGKTGGDFAAGALTRIDATISSRATAADVFAAR